MRPEAVDEIANNLSNLVQRILEPDRRERAVRHALQRSQDAILASMHLAGRKPLAARITLRDRVLAVPTYRDDAIVVVDLQDYAAALATDPTERTCRAHLAVIGDIRPSLDTVCASTTPLGSMGASAVS
jgi:hypothetical protein